MAAAPRYVCKQHTALKAYFEPATTQFQMTPQHLDLKKKLFVLEVEKETAAY